MKLFKNLTIMMVMLFCVMISRRVNAGILWEKELALDANTNSAMLASCLNKDASGVIVTTIECPKGSFPKKGVNILWEIGSDGNAARIVPKNTDGSQIWTNANPVGPGCAIASDGLGNLLTVGILSKQKDEQRQRIAVVSMTDSAEKTMSPRNYIESHSIKKLIPLKDDTFILIGSRSSNDGDGLCLDIDNQGKILQEEQFDAGRNERFTGADWITSNNPRLVIVGSSVKHSNESNAGFSGDNFILLYDPNLKIVHEDYFTGWKSVSALSLATSQPEVCYLANGNIVVIYNKEGTDSKTRLWARCYTQELKLLWEKEIFVTNRFLFYFDVTPWGSAGFVVGMVQRELLEFYFFDQEGIKLDYARYEGVPGGAVGINGFNLIRVNSRTIAVFDEGTAGNIKEASIKAKVIALD
jgi:hypothetical protein